MSFFKNQFEAILDILPQLREWKVEELGILTDINGDPRNYKWEPYIFKSIVHINMSRLTKLNIEDKKVNSFEPLCIINMPILDTLIISSHLSIADRTDICCFKELRKLNSPYLHHIDISQNRNSADLNLS